MCGFCYHHTPIPKAELPFYPDPSDLTYPPPLTTSVSAPILPPTPNLTSPFPSPPHSHPHPLTCLDVCTQLTYFEFAKEELEQLDNGVSGTATATTSFTSSSSDTQDSSQPTGQTTPNYREKHLRDDDEQEDYAHQHQQQHHHGEGVGEGEGVPSGARHHTLHQDEQQQPGGEGTSGARQYR